MQFLTPQQFAATLRTTGFRDGQQRKMQPSADGAITVNITGLTAQEQGLARAALKEWSAIANLRFAETTGGAQITYSHAGTSAHATTRYSGDRILSAEIEIGASRVAPGDGIGSYVFRTYMHETAHALGLGHPQNYGKVTSFAKSAIANDSWQMSLLSYFDQNENTAIKATKAYNLTPMIADYLAMRGAYGAVAVRAGDTVYGNGSTAGGALDKAAAMGARAAFLIADSGGTDEVRFSGFTAPQRIDLRPGAISNVMGAVGNMQIAPDTVIENATGGRGNDVLIGNAAANRLNGGGGSDRMEGGAGNDIYIVDGNDTVIEGPAGGVDTVISSVSLTLMPGVENLTLTGGATVGTGNALANVIIGNALGNTLDGRGGADRLIGGAGNDLYLWGAGDVVVEVAGGGVDTVRSALNHQLAAHVENLVLTGAAVKGFGNAQANTITGTAGANLLVGGGGADTLIGGAGNDTYTVDGLDRVVEYAGGGVDLMQSYGNLALAGGVENGRLLGNAATRLMGNGLGNRLEGNAAANVLNGGAGNDTLLGAGGADTLIGGAGDDVYHVGKGDIVIEADGGGRDTVLSSVGFALPKGVENLTLTGSAVVGTGNGLANVLRGNAAANTLNGGGGDDLLFGGAGADRFIFTSGRDRIADFVDDVDTLALSRSTLHISSLAEAFSHATQQAGGVLFDFGVNEVFINGAKLAQLRDDVILI